MSHLFSPLRLRELDFKHRVFVSPMCQYSCQDGLANAWHLMHLGARAVGGAALVMAEATAVSPEGRISPADLGLWDDARRDALAPVAAFVRAQGAIAGIQLAHAGRKASTEVPWRGGKAVSPAAGGWQPLAPSALAFAEDFPLPRAMTEAEVDTVCGQFVAAARRAR